MRRSCHSRSCRSTKYGRQRDPSKLYRIPEEGMFSGVCAGIADYFNIPVLLVRAIVVILSLSGLFFLTILVYIALSYFLEPVSVSVAERHRMRGSMDVTAAKDTISELENELEQSEQRLRELERYVTSDTFRVERRFRHL